MMRLANIQVNLFTARRSCERSVVPAGPISQDETERHIRCRIRAQPCNPACTCRWLPSTHGAARSSCERNKDTDSDLAPASSPAAEQSGSNPCVARVRCPENGGLCRLIIRDRVHLELLRSPETEPGGRDRFQETAR